MVNITRQGQGQCIWCAKHTETGVEVEFADGLLKGHLCRKHFWAAMQIRQENAESRTTPEKPERREPAAP